MNAREHLEAVDKSVPRGTFGLAVRYLLAREAEREATPPCAVGAPEVRYDSDGLPWRRSPSGWAFIEDGGKTTRDVAWGNAHLTRFPPPAPVQGEAAPPSAGEGEQQVKSWGLWTEHPTPPSAGEGDEPAHLHWAGLCIDSACSDKSSPHRHPTPPPAPVQGEAAVDALARVFCDRMQSWDHHDATDDHPCTRCKEYAAVALSVPGYGPTGASDGAGEVERATDALVPLLHSLDTDSDDVMTGDKAIARSLAVAALNAARGTR